MIQEGARFRIDLVERLPAIVQEEVEDVAVEGQPLKTYGILRHRRGDLMNRAAVGRVQFDDHVGTDQSLEGEQPPASRRRCLPEPLRHHLADHVVVRQQIGEFVEAVGVGDGDRFGGVRHAVVIQVEIHGDAPDSVFPRVPCTVAVVVLEHRPAHRGQQKPALQSFDDCSGGIETTTSSATISVSGPMSATQSGRLNRFYEHDLLNLGCNSKE